jgi:hypothetical protein
VVDAITFRHPSRMSWRFDAPLAEQVRGHLMVRTIEEFEVADASRLHLDLTAIRFAGAHPGSELVTKGWAAELPAFVAALDTLRAQLPSRLVVVADSGLGYLGTLCALNTVGTRFVVPLRADTGWAQRFDTDPAARLDTLQTLDHVSAREQRLPAQKRTVWKGLLRPFPVTDDTGTHTTTCGWPTSGPAKRPPPSPRPANAP